MQQSREVERYDFEATKNGTEAVVIEQDGWIIEKGSMWEELGAFYDEYAPAKDFYKIQKWFYPNGKDKAPGYCGTFGKGGVVQPGDR